MKNIKVVRVAVRFLIRLALLAIFLFLRQRLEINKDFFEHTFNIFHSILSFGIFLAILNIALAILILLYRLRKQFAYNVADNVIAGLNNLYYILVFFGVIVMILGFWNIDIKELLTSLSIVAAALAIISKDFVSSILSGIIISFSNDIAIDDYVMIGTQKGKVVDVSLTKLALLNDDDVIIYIPNDKVYQSEIINYTKKDIRKVSIDFDLDLEYLTTVEHIENQLISSLSDYMEHIESDSFNLKIVKVYHDYLSLKFQYQLKRIDREVEKNIRRKTIRSIVNSIRS